MKPTLRNPCHLLALGFGAGLAPRAPGTAGTLVAVPLYLALEPLPPAWYLTIVAALFLLGVWVCGRTARELGVGDPGAIVWDEIVGYLATMAMAPHGWFWIAAGFALFRIFDIFKPWPVSVADRDLHGGLGIMLDDLLAAGYAWVGLQGLAYLLANP